MALLKQRLKVSCFSPKCRMPNTYLYHNYIYNTYIRWRAKVWNNRRTSNLGHCSACYSNHIKSGMYLYQNMTVFGLHFHLDLPKTDIFLMKALIEHCTIHCRYDSFASAKLKYYHLCLGDFLKAPFHFRILLIIWFIIHVCSMHVT